MNRLYYTMLLVICIIGLCGFDFSEIQSANLVNGKLEIIYKSFVFESTLIYGGNNTHTYHLKKETYSAKDGKIFLEKTITGKEVIDSEFASKIVWDDAATSGTIKKDGEQ